MTQKKDETITTEVISRLDELFGDEKVAGDSEELFTPQGEPETEPEPIANNESPQPDQPDTHQSSSRELKPAEASKNPFSELDAIVLSIEWEITDEIMKSFIDEVNRLKALYRNDKLISMFLQLHGTIGKYISTNKAQSHPDSIRLLNSAYSGMKSVLSSPEMPDAEKKKLLAAEVKKTKELKKKILLGKSTASSFNQSATSTAPPTSANASETLVKAERSKMALEQAVEEIKATVRAEIASLKKDLKAIMSNL